MKLIDNYESMNLYIYIITLIILINYIFHTFSANSRIKIPFGYHKYPFNFQLPYNIPSSFEHKYGHVRYTIKAVMDRPWKFDHQTKIAFTVISTLDLNAHREKCVRY